VQVPQQKVNAVNDAISHRFAAFQQEYGQMEPGLCISTTPTTPPASCLTAGGSQQVLDLLLTLPHGVLKNSHAVAGGLVWVCRKMKKCALISMVHSFQAKAC
jgi:dipeptidase D